MDLDRKKLLEAYRQSSDKNSLSQLLDAGLPSPKPGLWPTMTLKDEFGEDTGEIDVDRCVDLLDLGVGMDPDFQAHFLACHPEMADRVAAAIASSRGLDHQTVPKNIDKYSAIAKIHP